MNISMSSDELCTEIDELLTKHSINDLAKRFFKDYGFIQKLESKPAEYNEYLLASVFHLNHAKMFEIMHQRRPSNPRSGAIKHEQCSCGFSTSYDPDVEITKHLYGQQRGGEA